MIAPTSDERIERIAKSAEGFLYCVSSLGVTGVRETITTNVAAMIEKVRKYIRFITDRLTTRGVNHDASKLESPEVEMFAE